MVTPRVIELPRSLESVSPDTFIGSVGSIAVRPNMQVQPTEFDKIVQGMGATALPQRVPVPA